MVIKDNKKTEPIDIEEGIEKYLLVNKNSMSKKQVEEEYGDVSFAYSARFDERYDIIAISKRPAPILRSYLLIDKVSFLGTDEAVNKYVPEVI